MLHVAATQTLSKLSTTSFGEPADAFASGAIGACIVNGIVGKRDASRVHRGRQISPSGASAVTTRRECVARCWPPVRPRGRCDCL